MRSIDWSKTAVGPVDRWPQSLCTALSILLDTGFPMYIAWGPEFTQFYNDGYRPILGSTKHPAAMGISTRETFAEIWHIIGPMFEGVMEGKSVTLTDFHLPLDRHGFAEECYFIFSYSPIRVESRGVGGVLVTVTETTERVLGARRLLTLQDLVAKIRHAATATAACEGAAGVLSENSADVPFALIYRVGEDGKHAWLAGTARIAAGGAWAPASIDLTGSGDCWGLSDIRSSGRPELVDLPAVIAGAAADDGPAPSKAYAVPIFTPGGDRLSGFLLAALSPRVLFDDKYRSFLELVAGHVGAAIASAQALEEAHARATALAEIDRAKTAFFSNVSHEFRTPLTLILGPAEDALAAEAVSGDERERWSIVHRSALRLSKLVNTLLDFSRIEAGRVQASYEPTQLAAVTGELASMFRSAIERGGLTLRLDLRDEGEAAYIDREMWEKIILNLLSNALKFTFEGEIAVSLRIVGDSFEVIVRDSGIGIAAADVPNVFDRFHRIRGARARTQEGTGIGLALVAELVRLHAGHVTVESEVGRGTAFFVRIPRGRAHLPADRIAAPRELPSTSTGAAPYIEEALRWMAPPGARLPVPEPAPSVPAAAARPRILLADDNADMRDYLARLLRERWDVEAVADGQSALASVRRSPPDLVLSDVMMPVLDGFGLLRAIRTDPALRRLPVILLSARAGEEATTEGLSAGASDYIVKPFSARELLVRVASQVAVAAVAREEQAIEEAARVRLYNHFMQAPFPVAVLRGPEHVVELANPLTLAAWGKDGGAVGQTLLRAVPELRGQPFLDYLDRVFATGVTHKASAQRARLVRRPQGQPEDVFFDFVYAPLRDGHGVVDGILLCGFEVTAQVHAAQELKRLLSDAESNERQFREVVENLPELAWTAQADGYIDYYNRRWYEYTGSVPAEMQGWGWKRVHDPQKVDEVVERWSRSIASGEPFEMEFPLRGADGVFRWFLTRARPLRDGAGRIIRWFGSNTNIDERRKNEDFKETFLGVLGHDLRNPLNTILTTARVLLMRADFPSELSKRVERVVTSGVRMQRMIEQLLDLTRARLAGGIPITLSDEPIELGPVVAKIADEVRDGRSGTTTTIDMRIDGDAKAHVDVDRFEQVVSNLVGNAVTHGDPARGVQIWVTGTSQETRVTIQNYGKPIEPAFLPHLFDPFARGEKPQGRSAGLGLGLYISERIVAAHGGCLTVRSDERDGTRFEVTLPSSLHAS